MKDAPDEGFRPGRTGSSLLWDEGNRRDGDQPARRVRTRRGGEGCGGPLRLCRRERRGSGGSPLGARRKPVRLGPRRARDHYSDHRLRLRRSESGRDHSRRGGPDRPCASGRSMPGESSSTNTPTRSISSFSMPATAAVSGSGSADPTGATKTPTSTTTITPANASPPRSPGPTGLARAATSWLCTRPSRPRNSARCSRGSSDPTTSRSRRKGCQEEDRHPH